jgi:hypothetical protein
MAQLLLSDLLGLNTTRESLRGKWNVNQNIFGFPVHEFA